jgi:hypothetical protein
MPDPSKPTPEQSPPQPLTDPTVPPMRDPPGAPYRDPQPPQPKDPPGKPLQDPDPPPYKVHRDRSPAMPNGGRAPIPGHHATSRSFVLPSAHERARDLFLRAGEFGRARFTAQKS